MRRRTLLQVLAGAFAAPAALTEAAEPVVDLSSLAAEGRQSKTVDLADDGWLRVIEEEDCYRTVPNQGRVPDCSRFIGSVCREALPTGFMDYERSKYVMVNVDGSLSVHDITYTVEYCGGAATDVQASITYVEET